jgi:hypothetical protein
VTSTASCQAGEVVVGGGHRMGVSADSEWGKFFVRESYPASSTTYTSVIRSTANILNSASISIQAYAICAK